MRAGTLMLVSLVLTARPVLAQQPPSGDTQRQLGAHAHGTGKLSIAIERRTVEIEFEAPGSDIVGFEHAAKTPEQKQAVAEARALLAKPLALFKLPEAAGCKVGTAKVKLIVGGAHNHGHAKDAKQTKAPEAAPHSEFEAEYTLTCAKPELIRSLDLDYFKSFPRAEALDITVIGAKGQQTKLKATKDKPRVELPGAT